MTTRAKTSVAVSKPTVKTTAAPKKTPVKSALPKEKVSAPVKVSNKSTTANHPKTTMAAPAKALTPTLKTSATPSASVSKITKILKPKKIKLVRDSFTIPKPEYLVLDDLKLRALELKHPVKKGELLRAGIKALAAMTNSQLLAALQAVPALKTGRPGK